MTSHPSPTTLSSDSTSSLTSLQSVLHYRLLLLAVLSFYLLPPSCCDLVMILVTPLNNFNIYPQMVATITTYTNRALLCAVYILHLHVGHCGVGNRSNRSLIVGHI